jgi:hypothetical protein
MNCESTLLLFQADLSHETENVDVIGDVHQKNEKTTHTKST